MTQGPQLDNFEEQLRRGGLELAILLAMSPSRRYGLELIRHLERVTDLVVTEGTVYPILGRLTRQGLLRSEWIAAEGPHPRKYYELTERGRRRLEEMLKHWRSFAGKIERLIAARREER